MITVSLVLSNTFVQKMYRRIIESYLVFSPLFLIHQQERGHKVEWSAVVGDDSFGFLQRWSCCCTSLSLCGLGLTPACSFSGLLLTSPLPATSLLLKYTDPIQVLFSKKTPNIPASLQLQNVFQLWGIMNLYHALLSNFL